MNVCIRMCTFVTRTKIQFNHGDKSYHKAYHIQIINCFCFLFERVSSLEPISQPANQPKTFVDWRWSMWSFVALLFCLLLFCCGGGGSVGGRVGGRVIDHTVTSMWSIVILSCLHSYLSMR